MKKLIVTLIMVISLLIISGCSGGSYSIVRGHVSATSHYIQGSYKTFDGNYYKNIELETGDVIHFEFESTTDKGTIQPKLYYKDELISTIENDTEVIIDETGTYQVKVFADNHGGSFDVSWDIN